MSDKIKSLNNFLEAGVSVSKLDMDDGDVVVLKSSRSIPHHEIARLCETIRGDKNLTFVVLRAGDQLESLDERQMGNAGWFRKAKFVGSSRRPARVPSIVNLMPQDVPEMILEPSESSLDSDSFDDPLSDVTVNPIDLFGADAGADGSSSESIEPSKPNEPNEPNELSELSEE